jgi:hypothetical protein
MDKKRIQYAPFHAINEFMLPDFRQNVVQAVLSDMVSLSQERRKSLVGIIQKTVKIPGFRNVTIAPLALKVKGAIGAFEKSSQFVGQMIAAWSELRPELRQQVYDMLQDRGWEVQPLDVDRSKLPGFLIAWPRDDNYDELDKDFAARYPEVKIAENDMRLMAVWVGGRLPYNANEEQDGEEGD